MRRRAESLACALVLALLAAPSPARADEEESAPRTGPVYVVWIAPLECPRQPAVSAEIDQLIGAQPRRSREGVEVRARVSRLERGDPALAWHADIEVVSAGETETRAVDGESCASVAHAVAVIAAVASDASSAGPVRERARSFFAAASGAFDSGTLPSAALGVDVALGWRARGIELGVDGAIFLPQHAAAPRGDAGADFSLLRGRAHGCGVLTLDRVTLAPCMALGVDALRAHGTGSDHPADASSTALTVGGEVTARAQITAFFAVRAVAGLAVPLGRPTFAVAGGGAVHRPAAVTVPLALGAEIDF